jgi:carbon storage regulator
MLVLARKINERIVIGEDVEVSVVDIKGDQVKLGIKAPKRVKVYRQEVYEAIQQENRAAAQSAAQSLRGLEGVLGSAGKQERPQGEAPTHQEDDSEPHDS